MEPIKEYTKKDGTTAYMFRAYLGIDPRTGKERQTTRRGFASRKEAKIALSRIVVETEDLGLQHSDNPTFQEVFTEWFTQHKQEIKPTTAYIIEGKFKRILREFGSMKIKTIDSRFCQRVINAWAKELKSFQDYKIQANLVFKYALKWEIIRINPMDRVTLPKRKEDIDYEEAENKFYTKQELTTFLNCLKEHKSRSKLHMMFRLLAYTGARKGELQALHWSDVDFHKKQLRLKKTLVQVNGVKKLQQSKTASSSRVISVDNETLNLLKEWRKEQMERHLRLGIPFMDGDKQPIFTTYHYKSGKMDYCRLAYLNGSLQRIYELYPELPQITVHGFRHTHASLLFEAGLRIKDVQTRLGHSDIATTMNIYTHVTETAQEQAADIFEKFMTN